MTICPVCYKPVAVSSHGSVFYHRDGIGKPCAMIGHRLLMSDPDGTVTP